MLFRRWIFLQGISNEEVTLASINFPSMWPTKVYCRTIFNGGICSRCRWRWRCWHDATEHSLSWTRNYTCIYWYLMDKYQCFHLPHKSQLSGYLYLTQQNQQEYILHPANNLNILFLFPWESHQWQCGHLTCFLRLYKWEGGALAGCVALKTTLHYSWYFLRGASQFSEIVPGVRAWQWTELCWRKKNM